MCWPNILTIRYVVAENTLLCFFIFETVSGPNIDDGSEVCEQFQEDASRHMARGLKTVHGRAALGPFNVANWLILL